MNSRQIQSCDFKLHERKARAMDPAALAYTIQDCHEAAKIHDEMDRQWLPNNAGRYWDELAVYYAELQRRVKAAGLSHASEDHG